MDFLLVTSVGNQGTIALHNLGFDIEKLGCLYAAIGHALGLVVVKLLSLMTKSQGKRAFPEPDSDDSEESNARETGDIADKV